jgi:hypothetical protein
MLVSISRNPADELCLAYHRIYFRLRKSSHPRAVRTAEIVPAYMPKKQAALPGTVGPSSRSGEWTPTQNFLEVLTEASAPQRMALKPGNDREMKGLEGSNPLFSATQASMLRILQRPERKSPGRPWWEASDDGRDTSSAVPRPVRGHAGKPDRGIDAHDPALFGAQTGFNSPDRTRAISSFHSA